MFLRQHHRSKDGKKHGYWSLVETVRTPDGPRQRTQWFGVFTGTRLEATLRTVQRRHRATYARRTGDLAAQDYQTGRRSGKATQPTSTGVTGTIKSRFTP